MVYFDDKVTSAGRSREPRTELIQEICCKELGEAATEIHAIVGQGISNQVFRLSVANGDRVILRLCDATATETHSRGYEKEIWCLKFLKKCDGFRVPTPLASGSTPTFKYMLEEYIDGKPGNSEEFNQRHVWQRLGECAARFNALPVSGYGEKLDLSAGGHFAATWHHTLQQNLNVVFRDDYWVSSGVCTAAQLHAVRTLLENLYNLDAPAGLVHIDLAPKNCIIEPGGGIALIDWEMAEGGPTPYSQLAAVAGWWGCESDIYQSFSAGYASVVGPIEGTTEHVRVLALLNSLHAVRWAQDNDRSVVEEYSRSAASFIPSALG